MVIGMQIFPSALLIHLTRCNGELIACLLKASVSTDFHFFPPKFFINCSAKPRASASVSFLAKAELGDMGSSISMYPTGIKIFMPIGYRSNEPILKGLLHGAGHSRGMGCKLTCPLALILPLVLFRPQMLALIVIQMLT